MFLINCGSLQGKSLLWFLQESLHVLVKQQQCVWAEKKAASIVFKSQHQKRLPFGLGDRPVGLWIAARLKGRGSKNSSPFRRWQGRAGPERPHSAARQSKGRPQLCLKLVQNKERKGLVFKSWISSGTQDCPVLFSRVVFSLWNLQIIYKCEEREGESILCGTNVARLLFVHLVSVSNLLR